uniref:Uncharacterized protein n=1 Tax=Musa acuminata subsp. malaccensis TaxID=214687 RepID=A0A804L8D2_MUSAM
MHLLHIMKRHKGGFRLGRRLSRIWRCVSRLGRRRDHTRPLMESSTATTRLAHWGRSICRLLRRRPHLGDRAPLLEEQRYVVPVIYFNHPLFGELLQEAEEEFGFHHPGGITIPCPAAEFERVRTRVAAAGAHLCRKSRSRFVLS